jgi:hypothetical protein
MGLSIEKGVPILSLNLIMYLVNWAGLCKEIKLMAKNKKMIFFIWTWNT